MRISTDPPSDASPRNAELEHHPAAALFPLMNVDGDEFGEFVAERGLPRLAEEFRSCRQGVCRRVRDSRPGWAEAVASGDVAHAVIERMLEAD